MRPNPAPGQQPNQQPPAGPGNLVQRMIFNRLYQSNPAFRQFAQQMQGKTPEQAFQEHGLDYNQFQNMNTNDIRNMLGF